MPGRHQKVIAYANFGGGTDLWCSGSWDERGQWFEVWQTEEPKPTR